MPRRPVEQGAIIVAGEGGRPLAALDQFLACEQQDVGVGPGQQGGNRRVPGTDLEAVRQLQHVQDLLSCCWNRASSCWRGGAW